MGQLRYLDDYIPQVKERFPELSEKIIKEILHWGLARIVAATKRHCDILLKSREHGNIYIGKVFKDEERWTKYKRMKYAARVRLLHTWAKKPYSGYYYFGVKKDEFDDFMEAIKRRKKYTFKDVYFHYLPQEVKYVGYMHIFRVKYPVFAGYLIEVTEYTTRDIEYVFKRKYSGNYEPVNYKVKETHEKRQHK